MLDDFNLARDVGASPATVIGHFRILEETPVGSPVEPWGRTARRREAAARAIDRIMRQNLLVLLMAAATPGVASPVDATSPLPQVAQETPARDDRIIYGAGNQPCAAWVAERANRSQHFAQLSWVLGYMSSASAPGRARQTDRPAIEAFVDTFCGASPLEPISSAVAKLSKTLLNEFPPGAPPQAWLYGGLADAYCGTFTADKETGLRVLALSWIHGYTSAVSGSGRSPLRRTDERGIDAFVDRYCAANPSKHLLAAAESLLESLRPGKPPSLAAEDTTTPDKPQAPSPAGIVANETSSGTRPCQ